MAKWKIELTPTAIEHLAKITDKRIQKSIGKTINKLEDNPELQGKPLFVPLLGYRSIRAVGQRYRVIYMIIKEKVVVSIVALGIRKEGSKLNVYIQAQRLLEKGLLDPETPKPSEDKI